MLLSFKTFETETFGTEARLLFPRADHLLCPASSLFRVYVCPLTSYSSPGSLADTLVAIGRASCPFDCDYSHLPYIFASAKCSASHSLFVGECTESGTTFFTPRAAWSLPCFQLVRLASVSIATVQASIPQSGPRLRFGATPLVPCPFAFQPNLDSVRCVAEQTLRTFALVRANCFCASLLRTQIHMPRHP